MAGHQEQAAVSILPLFMQARLTGAHMLWKQFDGLCMPASKDVLDSYMTETSS
jgi:hypothetical protein